MDIPKLLLLTGQLKLCEVIPMDLNGGLRIKGYWDLKRAQKQNKKGAGVI